MGYSSVHFNLGIWKERNRRIFKDKKLDHTQFLNKLEACIVEVANNRNFFGRKDIQFSLEDDRLRKLWFGLKIPPFIGQQGSDKQSLRNNCVWTPLSTRWYKLNFDEASKGNPEKAGFGCCIHNETGQMIAYKCGDLGITSNNIAEGTTLIEGLLLCKKLKLDYIAIEGDSTLIINAIRTGKTPNWRLNGLVNRGKNLLSCFNHFTINHIYREGNQTVDALANKGVDGRNEEFIFTN